MPDDPLSAAHREAARLMTVCNACRYCEGLCAVFPAMELRTAFKAGDLDYLANLCHACGACYNDCQYAPPHAFAVDLPAALAELRAQSRVRYAWPALGRHRQGRWVAVAPAALPAALFGMLFAARGPRMTGGNFYRFLPHHEMAPLFAAAGILAAALLAVGAARFRRGIGGESAHRPAVRDALSLRYLDGGGGGCPADAPVRDNRRLFHHFTAGGFALCFLSTGVATLYHYLLHRPAPYAWHEPPVLLGLVGGIGLVVGASGLFRERRRAGVPRPDNDGGFLGLLWATGASGLMLLATRTSPAMPALLAIHLGCVMGLFLTLPYGKAVHGLYRYISLARHAAEQRKR